MTREEQIKEAAEDYSTYIDSTDEERYNSTELEAFKEGAEWADRHPKLHWIDVKEDLPYNHSHLMVTKYATVNVFVLKKGGSASVNSMVNRNGKWEWDAWREEYTHWMPIPSI